MKKVVLCDTAYIELTDEAYNNLKNITLIGEDKMSVMGMAKEIVLPRGMYLIVPVKEFKEG